MKLKFENDFENLLKDSLVERKVDPLEHIFFIDSFVETGQTIPQIKIDKTNYLLGFGSVAPVYDIENKLIDRNGHEIIIAKGISARVKGYSLEFALADKRPKLISKRTDSELLLPGNYEARFVSVKPEELKDGKIERYWKGGRKHCIIPMKDLSKIEFTEQIGGTENMHVFQKHTAYHLNHKKEEIFSLYPIVRY